jgi:hypothetical protein
VLPAVSADQEQMRRGSDLKGVSKAYDSPIFCCSLAVSLRRVSKGDTAICKVQFVKNRDRFSDQSVCGRKRATPIIAGSPVTY